ncbi:MAG TPA: hypothetical protein VE616_05945 [Candidatus Udaeobacter sp.]|jgi:hypothetical protein|nr:hypothetical protein [Candidatus Udaeobacter sp.]
MNIDSGLLAAVLLTATTLQVRMSIQGFEQAVLSTAIEDCLNDIKAVRSVWATGVYSSDEQE